MLKHARNTAIINAIYLMTKIQLTMKDIKSNTNHLDQWVKEIQETQLIMQQHIINHPMLEECIQFIIHHILEPFLEQLNHVVNHSHQSAEFDKHLIEFNYTVQRMVLIREYIPSISAMSTGDLFCKTQEDPEWMRLVQFIEFLDLAEPSKIKQEFAKFNKFISIGYTYHQIGLENRNWLHKMVVQNVGGLRMLINSKEAQQNKLKKTTAPTIEYIQHLWNLQDQLGVVKNFMKCSMASIASHHKIYIPYLFSPTFTKEKINAEINQGTLYQIDDFNGFDLNEDNLFDQISEPLCNKRNQQNKIKIRLLSANKRVFKNHIDYSQIVQQVQDISKSHHKISQHSVGNSQIPCEITKVVLQIHGGGWVAMSSFCHQTYTRKWANYMGSDTIIFSVDYRLLPKYPYPDALEDIWQTYLWIIYFSEFYLNINVNQIVLAGDSAGANMALGVCYRAMKNRIRIPDGLFLPYPAVNLNFKQFNPYLLNGLIDIMAPATVLKVVLQEYLKCPSLRPDVDPYLSPIVADDTFLLKLPKTIIMCGQMDTLTGDVIRFTNKLVTLNKDVKTYIYNGLSHGFLNFDIPVLAMPELKNVIHKSCELLKELFVAI